ncbi:histidinol dehydrogenase [Parvularcula sp. LCG005]|uniref:histidinol dehydrogenase n=1 Tax=Parvularcula sp. LCG005 TaxID=3078805 RepID=UPI0029434A3A|nr:histidinol dehydrogenase [Parvularcula sp. LCG005]WOI53783.1 histidinol dehydrogenase [Parvularcula sp. LCG005]
MVRRLKDSDATFGENFAELLTLKREASADVGATVAALIAEVRADGDEALYRLTEKFDRFDARARGLVITQDEVDAAVEACDPASLDALKLAADRIEAYHERQLPSDEWYTDDAGVSLGWRWTPIDAVGLYVPGGRAAYPSSVLMNAIPARVAGAERLVMVVPTPDDVLNPLVLAAARLAGITEIYRIGGAQAVAALAYGTATIAKVDKIVGPGNAWVAAAKRLVFGQVGIDSIAGPSEILVVADGQNDPDWIAADLLSQAEHDPSSQSVLITDDADFADRVDRAVDAHIARSPRGEITRAAWDYNSAIIVCKDFESAMPLVNRLAAEHLELAVDEPEELLPMIRHAGAIFLGRYTPEAIGDYVAGPDHVLPTAQAARFSSGLSTLDFMKRTSLLSCSPEAVRAVGPAAVRLAEEEGLWAHAQSVAYRLK